MITHNLGSMVAAAWEDALRELPDPWRTSFLNPLFGLPRLSYREALDQRQYNIYGEVIPRRVIVRRNLRRLGNIRLNPERSDVWDSGMY